MEENEKNFNSLYIRCPSLILHKVKRLLFVSEP
jgi:hypothetical protein